MAALPYMQFEVAKYLADTSHLTTLEHGAYLLLIFNYWQRGKPLPDCNKRLASVARMSEQEFSGSVREALSEFFKVDNGYWVHTRIERDILSTKQKVENARRAGKASAMAKKNGRSTTAATIVQQKEKKRKEKKIREEETMRVFELARKEFSGRKRGLETEFSYFQKTHKDWRDVLPLLLPAIQSEQRARSAAKANGAFFPTQKDFKSWIYNRYWEQEWGGSKRGVSVRRCPCGRPALDGSDKCAMCSVGVHG